MLNRIRFNTDRGSTYTAEHLGGPRLASINGETPELTAPKVPDDVRGISLDEPITRRRSGQNT